MIIVVTANTYWVLTNTKKLTFIEDAILIIGNIYQALIMSRALLEHSTCINSFEPHACRRRSALFLSPFFRWGKGSPEKGSDMLSVTQKGSDGAGVWPLDLGLLPVTTRLCWHSVPVIWSLSMTGVDIITRMITIIFITGSSNKSNCQSLNHVPNILCHLKIPLVASHCLDRTQGPCWPILVPFRGLPLSHPPNCKLAFWATSGPLHTLFLTYSTPFLSCIDVFGSLSWAGQFLGLISQSAPDQV